MSSSTNLDVQSFRVTFNNLHPGRHPELYSVLETPAGKAVPLWDECLMGRPTKKQTSGHLEPFIDNREQLRINVTYCSDRHFFRPDDATDDEWRRMRADDKILIQPTVQEEYVPFAERPDYPKSRPVDLLSDFPGGLQIIFKLANIHLTPNKPTYSGSNWHFEAALSERICATALFYYDQENIEDSYLEFRQPIEEFAMVSLPNRATQSPRCQPSTC